MSLQLRAGEKKKVTFSSIDITGFTFQAHLYNSVEEIKASTKYLDGQEAPVFKDPGFPTGIASRDLIGGEGLDLDKVHVNCLLFQDGKEITIFSGQLQPLAMESAFFDSEWDNCNPFFKTVYSKGANGFLQIASVDLGGIINLRDDDKIVLEVRVQGDAIKGFDNSSYLDCDVVEGIGLQYTTPQITSQAVGNGESKYQHSVGDNTTAVTFINSDINSVDESTSPIVTARLYSDRYDVNDDWSDLVQKRVKQLTTNAQQDTRGASFSILNSPVDKCRVEFDLNPSQVNTSENYVIYRTFSTCATLVGKAKRRASKHMAKHKAKVWKGAKAK